MKRTFVALAMSVALIATGSATVAASRYAGRHGGHAAVGPHGGAAAVGPRGSTATRNPTTGITTAHGAHGGTATHNPTTGRTTARGAAGGAAVVGPGGRGAAVGPGGNTAVRGRSGVAVRNREYYAGGSHYVRPTWGATQVNVYQRSFVGYPGWHSYGVYHGLYPPLAVFPGLAFLSAGLLIGSYVAKPAEPGYASAPAPVPQTIYVYIIEENGLQKEYRVDSQGHILSTRIIRP